MAPMCKLYIRRYFMLNSATQDKPMKVFGYVRLSRDEDKQQNSLTNQKDILIDYAHKEADTNFGKIGVKVWIYKGGILPEKKNKGGNDNGTNTKKN